MTIPRTGNRVALVQFLVAQDSRAYGVGKLWIVQWWVLLSLVTPVGVEYIRVDHWSLVWNQDANQGNCRNTLVWSVIVICVTIYSLRKRVPPVRTFFIFAKVSFLSIESRSYMTGVTTAKLWWHLSNVNVISNSTSVVMKNERKWRTEKIDYVTPPLMMCLPC